MTDDNDTPTPVPTEVPSFDPLDDGEHMTREEFLAAVRDGDFTDDDGFASLATDIQVSDIDVDASEAHAYDWPDWATHVVWYNK